MQEKAPNEFDRVERHEAVAITPLIVFPSERHLAIVTGEEPSIGDGHAMCIAGKVAQDQLWPGQRGLRVDHPMHIKLSASRKLLWHYRVTTPTIMLASKELPYDDHTTGGPCYA
jgi:hypothetical protein